MTAVGIDIGGTFTDAVILRDDGSVGTAKTPSTPAIASNGEPKPNSEPKSS